MITPLTDPDTGTYCGVRMALQGMQLELLLGTSTITRPWPWPGFLRRPSELIFLRRGGRCSQTLILTWPHGTPALGVRLHTSKGRPPGERCCQSAEKAFPRLA